MPAFDFEGLDIGTDNTEVDAAFAKALGRETDTPEPTDEVTPGEEPAAEEEQQGQPRNEKGQFAPYEEQEADEEEPQAAVEPQQDDEVSQFLAKYGGDPEKALRGALELQKLQGRQSDELGQLRAELSRLQEQITKPAEQPQQYIPVTEQIVEELDALALENGYAAIQRVGQLGDPTGQLTERVMDIWFSVNPRQASAFQAALISQQTEQRVRAELEPIVQDRTANAEEQTAVEAWNLAASQFEGLNELAPAMKQVFEERPGLARAASAAADNPQELADIYLAVADIASAKAGAATSQVAQIAEQQQSAALKQTKKQAAVVRPAAVGSQPGATDDKPTEAQRIKSGIVGANSTSILDGWTNG